MGKIEALTVEAIPKPGTPEFEELAKQFAESVYAHFVRIWQQSAEQNSSVQELSFLASE